MKAVLFIIDSLQTGGAEKSLLDITSRFIQYEPVFLVLFPGDDLKASFESRGIQVIQLGLKPSYDFKRMALEVIPFVENINPVLIHSTLFRSDMVARILVKRLKLPLINSFVNNSYSPIRYKSLSLLQKLKLKTIQYWDGFTARHVDLFISNAEAIKASNAKALGIDFNKVKVIYRGRPVSDFTKSFDHLALKQSLLLSDELVFLNVSRLLDRKGQLDLIRAFAILKGQINQRVKLLIAGEGPYRKILEDAIAELDLSEEVMLLGARQDIPMLLQVADFFIFPSHYEGLPGALIEAMFAKIPIIASDIPENLECVDASCALLHPRGHTEYLAAKMLEAINYPQWDTLTDRAYQKALANFEIQAVAQLYEATYDALLDS